MKKNYLIGLLCMLMAVPAFADKEYLPIIKEGRKWIYFTCYPVQSKKGTYLHYEVGPTVEFDGKTYYEINRYDSDTFDGEKEPFGPKKYVREEGGKLYSRYHPSFYNESVTDIPIIDMTPEKREDLKFVTYDNDGQMSEFSGGGGAAAIFSLTVGGTERKVIKVSNTEWDDWDAYWIEGIGASRLDWWVTEMERPSISIIYRLVGCYDGDECIFTADDIKDPTEPVGETYLPIIKEGRKWVYNKAVPVWGTDYDIVYEFAGTKIVGGRTYHRLTMSSVDESGNVKPSDQEYYLWEKDGKLYTWSHPYNEYAFEIPILDMTPENSDDVKFVEFDQYGRERVSTGMRKADGVSTYTVRDIRRKRIAVAEGAGSDRGIYWVEGIGSSTLDCWVTEFPLPSVGIVYTLKGCYDGDECIFTADDFKNPAAIGSVGCDDPQAADTPVEYFDMQGRKVRHPQSGGLYLRKRGSTVDKVIEP